MGWLSDILKDYPALSVAKERLALAEERFKHIEEENDKLKKKVTELEKRNEQLSALAPKAESGSLEPIEVEILKILATSEEMPAAAFSQRTDVSETKAEYYAEKLADAEYVYQTYIVNNPVLYSLDQKGREYLVRNDLA